MGKHFAVLLFTVILTLPFIEQSKGFVLLPSSEKLSSNLCTKECMSLSYQRSLPSLCNHLYLGHSSPRKHELFYKSTDDNNNDNNTRTRSIFKWLSRKWKQIFTINNNGADDGKNDKTTSSSVWSLKPEPYWKYKIRPRSSSKKDGASGLLNERRNSFLRKRMKYGDFIPPNNNSTYGAELLYAQPEDKPVVIRRRLLDKFWTRQEAFTNSTPSDYYTETGAFE
mmetsp:Transcript_10916/g.16869  ORF Transcript_10916/g.16869 Transcript_10916/m.16869 type:complete len:224 (-) Transcript_10916:145-816(-)